MYEKLWEITHGCKKLRNEKVESALSFYSLPLYKANNKYTVCLGYHIMHFATAVPRV